MIRHAAAITSFGLLLACGVAAAEPARLPPWPRKLHTAEGVLVEYRPVAETWDDYRVLVVRQVTSFRRDGATERHHGVARLAMDTQVDWDAGEVTLSRPQLLGLEVPTLDEAQLNRAAAWRRQHLPEEPRVVSLARMLSWVRRSESETRDVEVRHPRPRIFLHQDPATLVLLDGPPDFFQTRVEGLEILANSDSLVLRTGGRVYLKYRRSWLSAEDLQGPWRHVEELPRIFSRMPSGGAFDRLRELMVNEPLDARAVPEVLVTHHEAELVRTNGPAVFEAIPGTRLAYATNSNQDLFRYAGEERLFLLVSGRWFRVDPDGGYGRFVRGRLPEDFARIPPDHPKAHVLASVPGTTQAQDATIAARVPRFRTVTAREARFQPRFVGGDPDWRPIEGTELEYAANTSQDVLRLDGRWLGCDRGLWFEAEGPQGSWSVLRELPEEVLRIPPSSAKHPLSYTRVEALDEDRVRVAVTPGYFGTYVADGVVVHGTGHDLERSPAFYRDALRRIREYYDEGKADPTDPHRPHLLEPFYQRTYGYGFRFDPSQGRFRPTRSGFTSTLARPTSTPPAVRPSELTRDERDLRGVYPGADGKLYRKAEDGSWQELTPDGWQPSDTPLKELGWLSPGTRGQLGRLPDPPPRPPPGKPTRLQARRESGKGEGEKPPGITRIEGSTPPKIPEGYDKYRWTTTYEAASPPIAPPPYLVPRPPGWTTYYPPYPISPRYPVRY